MPSYCVQVVSFENIALFSHRPTKELSFVMMKTDSVDFSPQIPFARQRNVQLILVDFRNRFVGLCCGDVGVFREFEESIGAVVIARPVSQAVVEAEACRLRERHRLTLVCRIAASERERTHHTSKRYSSVRITEADLLHNEFFVDKRKCIKCVEHVEFCNQDRQTITTAQNSGALLRTPTILRRPGRFALEGCRKSSRFALGQK